MVTKITKERKEPNERDLIRAGQSLTKAESPKLNRWWFSNYFSLILQAMAWTYYRSYSFSKGGTFERKERISGGMRLFTINKFS